jgi:hypothetical protein
MSEFNQPNDQHKGPQIKSEMKESDITIKIKKNKKQPKTEAPAEAQPVAFLDDHVDSYGKNLMASIANLIQESKKDDGPKRKKKTMTPEMIERCRQNLAKGRETIKKNKEAQSKKKYRTSTKANTYSTTNTNTNTNCNT